MSNARPRLRCKQCWQSELRGTGRGELHLYLCELCCSHVPRASSGHHTSHTDTHWKGFSCTETSKFGGKPLSFAACYHFASGLSFACLSCWYLAPIAQWDSELSERNIRGKHPSHLPFQLQAVWGGVSMCSRCAETTVISSSWLQLVIPGDAQFNSGTNVQRRVVLK